MGRTGIRWDDGAALAERGHSWREAPGWEGGLHPFPFTRTPIPPRPSASGIGSSCARRVAPPPGARACRQQCRRAPGHAVCCRSGPPGHLPLRRCAGGIAPRPVAALARAGARGASSWQWGTSVSYGATWRAPGEMTIATLGLGYADGFPRATDIAGGHAPSHRARAAALVPVVGRVTMDMTMVAVDGPVAVGDVATVFGGLVSLDSAGRARRGPSRMSC